MKAIFGALSLLAVLAMVGVMGANELKQAEFAAGGPSAVISAATSGAKELLPYQQIQQNLSHSVEGAVQQTKPDADGM